MLVILKIFEEISCLACWPSFDHVVFVSSFANWKWILQYYFQWISCQFFLAELPLLIINFAVIIFPILWLNTCVLSRTGCLGSWDLYRPMWIWIRQSHQPPTIKDVGLRPSGQGTIGSRFQKFGPLQTQALEDTVCIGLRCHCTGWKDARHTC